MESNIRKSFKVYLSYKEKRSLLAKAAECGLTGKGSFSKFFQKIAACPIVFMDENANKLAELFSRTQGNGS